MFKNIILIASFLVCGKGHTKEEQAAELLPITESLGSNHLYESVNVITGEYCESQTDLSTGSKLNIKRVHHSKDPLAMGWYFNQPILIEHEAVSLPEASNHYEFDENNRLTVIKAHGKWMRIQYPDQEQCLIEDSEGKWVTYQLKNSVETRDARPNLVDKVTFWDGREYSYEYIDHPTERRQLVSKRQNNSGNFLINEYYEANTDHPLGRHPVLGSIKLQKAPVGTDETPIVTNRFYYHLGFTEVIDALGNKTIYRHNKNKKLTAIENYSGDSLYRTEQFFWNSKNELVSKSIEDNSGKVLQSEHYRYDSWGNIIEHTLKGNLSGKGSYDESYTTYYRYSNDDLHNLVYHQSDNGVAVRYNYIDKTRLLSEKLTYDKGQLRKREFYTYDDKENLLEGISDDGVTIDKNNLAGVTERHISRLIPHPEHNTPEIIEELYVDLSDGSEHLIKKTVLVYSQDGKVTQQRIHDADGNFRYSLDFEYDVGGRLIRSNDIEGNATESVYDIQGRLIHYKDSNKEINLAYDYVDRLIRKEVKEIGKNDNLTSYEYDFNGNCIFTRDIFGNEIAHHYDSLGREIQTTFCDGTSVVNEYDFHDRIISTADAKGHTTRTIYNTRGKPCSIHYPDGSAEFLEYNKDGSLHKSVGKDGSYTIYTRDFLSRPIETNVFSPANHLISSTKNTYNTFHLTSTTNPKGLKTEHFYDYAGRLIKTSDGYRNVEYVYDSLGELKYQKEWLGNDYALIISERNEKNQVTEMRIEDPSNLTLKKIEVPAASNQPFVEYIYEDVLKKQMTDEKGYRILVTYDPMGRERAIEKRDPFGQMIAQQNNTFDSVGNMTHQTHIVFVDNKAAYEVTTAYTYGPCNRIESVTEAFGTAEQQTTTYSYNKAGQLEILTKPDGTCLHYAYAPGGAVAEISSLDHSFHYRYQYDQVGNAVLVENLIDGTATSRTYNDMNQMIQETLGNGLTLQYAYDNRGRRTALTLPDNSKVIYEYDAAYLKAIRRISQDNNLQYIHQYDQYDLTGHLTEQTLIGSLGKVNLSYDSSGKYISQKSEYYEESIQYDSNNLPEKITTYSRDGRTENKYAYDSLNQLTEESGDHNNNYKYDSIRNRLSKNGINYTLNLQNELLAAENSLFAYDANGNMIERKGSHFSYDALNRLISVDQNKLKITYSYDAFGRRITKSLHTENQTKTLRFLYDGENEIGSVDENGNIIEFRALGIGKGGEIGAAVAVELHGKIYAPIHDSRGSTRCLIDISNGSISGTSSFSAFGEEKATGDIINPWRYSGKRIDDETGLVFFGKRYYDPNIGRWITKDPLGAPEGPNRYAYVLNNPMSHVDQHGLYSLSDFIRSFWEGLQTFGSYSLHSFDTFKHHVSFIEYIRPHFDKVAQDIIGRTPLHLAGFYQDASECGVHGKGELHDKVRITLINGILNARIDYKNTIDYLSDCHGGINVHYVFDATEGWSWDIFKAIAAKFGYVSPQAHMLAETWKEMIDEMGGASGGGLIIHFAHSVGGTHTQAALSLMTPEELKMIRIITFGSATMIDHPGVESVTNFVSKRDGVPYLDPIGFIQGLLGLNNNTIFVGSWLGIPLIDHTLGSSTYYLLIELMGSRFTEEYFLY